MSLRGNVGDWAGTQKFSEGLMTRGDIHLMVEWETEGIWGDEEAVQAVSPVLREKICDWNWWWQLGTFYALPDFDPDECGMMGLELAKLVKLEQPGRSVTFLNEAILDRNLEYRQSDEKEKIQPVTFEIVLEEGRTIARPVMDA